MLSFLVTSEETWFVLVRAEETAERMGEQAVTTGTVTGTGNALNLAPCCSMFAAGTRCRGSIPWLAGSLWAVAGDSAAGASEHTPWMAVGISDLGCTCSEACSGGMGWGQPDRPQRGDFCSGRKSRSMLSRRG